MSVATKQSQPRPLRRIWKVPTARTRWLWLGSSVLLYAGIFVWYLYAIKTQQFPGPLNDPLRFFGILAYILVLGTATYALRRRFVRGLPGKVQSWLWMHTWVGIASVLIVLLHENYTAITHDFCQNAGCLSDAEFGLSALIALVFLVLSGITGRLLDVWQTHVIARDASANNVGIVSALEERILELEYTIERLCAGKSEVFKQFCLQAIEAGTNASKLLVPQNMPAPAQNESADFKRAYNTLLERTQLSRSLKRQKRARAIIRLWRTVHTVLAILALLIISFHGVMELLGNVFHVIKLP